jgi:hypothetical protein
MAKLRISPNWGTDGNGHALTMGHQVILNAETFKPDGAPLSEGLANIAIAREAPALLESLEEMLGAMDDGSDEPTLVKARAVVERARGGA